MNQAPTAITAYGYNPNAMWMPLPPSFAICPPGLEYLSQIDWLLIHQKYEILELITSFETANKYEVRNSLGEMVYFAKEENNFCVRNCLGSLRPFTMVISNHVGQQVIHLVRPFRCDGCCYPCCLQELEVQAPPGLPIGYIQQLWHPCLPKFVIQNEAHGDVLKIVGPCITSACCGDVVFEVTALDEQTSVGKISKKWGGVLQEFFTDVDFLGISFPLDLDVKMKAVMLGAGFLLDFIFFESGAGAGSQDSHIGGSCSPFYLLIFMKVQERKLRCKNCDTTMVPTGYSHFSNAEEQANPMTTKIYQVSMEEFLDQTCNGPAKMNQASTVHGS